MADARPGRPLSELDRVDWSSLEVRSGAATEVPLYLRAIAGADADTGLKSLDWLDDQLLHRGAVFSATPEAAPFVDGLVAQEPPLTVRLLVRLVRLLRRIAGGQGYNERFEAEFAAQGDDVANDSTFQRDKAEQAARAHRGRAAVTDAVPLLAGLLDHENRDLRVEVASSLGAAAAASPDAVAALTARLESEPDEAVQATLLLALQAARAPGGADRAQAFADANRPPLVRWAAATCRLLDAGTDTPDDVVAAVLAMAFDKQLEQVPLAVTGRLQPLDVIAAIGRERAVNALLPLRERDNVDAGLLVTRLLGQAVDGAEPLYRDPPRAAPFTELERRVLQTIVDWDHWWTLPLAATTLGRYVTPSDRDALRDALAG